MLSSPRNPSSTTRIFSSAEKCRRVARRMSLIASSAALLFRLGISVSSSLLAATMRSRNPPYVNLTPRCLKGADGAHFVDLPGDQIAAL